MYDAFISYSGHDERYAKAIEVALRRFPPSLIPGRGARVFREAPSLASTPHLWPPLHKALRTSNYLVLLASPAAAASAWVAAEVSHWIGLGRGDRLLLVLVGGSIVWDAAARDFDWTRTDAVPRQLAGMFESEPAYVDLRTLDPASIAPAHPLFRERIAPLARTISRLHTAPAGAEVSRRVQRRRSWSEAPAALSMGATVLVAAAVGLARAGIAGSRRVTISAVKRLRRRRPSPQLPEGVVTDDVHFTLTSPAQLPAGAPAEVTFWCHLDRDRETVLQRAMHALHLPKTGVAVKSEGPYEVRRGTVLSVALSVDGLAVEPPVKTVLWKGRTGNATFVVTTPAGRARAEHRGVASVRVEGIEIARLDFVLLAGGSQAAGHARHTSVRRHQRAFASYASEDRSEVLKRVQGIQTAAPRLEVFVDVISLRAGQYWEKEIEERIPLSDVFYLFWSRHAKASEWVEKEWRLAYEYKGLDFIDPVPLEPADVAPPPPELARKHFNERLIVHIERAAGR